ncbi:chorismate-binding protein [Streptomyces sp. M19]
MDMQWDRDGREPSTTAGLLGRYRADTDFFFSTARHTLLASGIRAPSTATEATETTATAACRAAWPTTWPPRSGRRGVRGPRPVAVGALPFRDSTRPRCTYRATRGGARPPGPRTPRRHGPTLLSAVPDPDADEYRRRVRGALERMNGHGLDKVVLARSLLLTLPAPVDVARLLANLLAADPDGYAYGLALGGPGGRTLVGASPELLVSRTGRAVVANPLAGSAPRGDDPYRTGRTRSRCWPPPRTGTNTPWSSSPWSPRCARTAAPSPCPPRPPARHRRRVAPVDPGARAARRPGRRLHGPRPGPAPHARGVRIARAGGERGDPGDRGRRPRQLQRRRRLVRPDRRRRVGTDHPLRRGGGAHGTAVRRGRSRPRLPARR